MSTVHLIVIKDDCFYVVEGHYRAIKQVLEEGVEKHLRKFKPRFLDAGYVLVDLNRKKAVNGQEGFALPRFKGECEVVVL
ncbi:MAG TPA: hypothetical protein VJJ82_01060 [Candidatus Nanoarchaeia archaeon]|nr:hypothetical protein [Candidatus Nanoarchaeia archaeon]